MVDILPLYSCYQYQYQYIFQPLVDSATLQVVQVVLVPIVFVLLLLNKGVNKCDPVNITKQ